MYTSTVRSGPRLLVLHPRPAHVFRPLIPLLLILYLLLLLSPHNRLLLLAMPPASSTHLTSSGFFNGMQVVFEPGALNGFTFFRPIPLTFSVSMNSILTHFPLFGFLVSLLCALIASTPNLAFSLVMPRTLAAASPFWSDRVYLFSELSTSSLSLLDPCSDCVGVNISLNNSSSLSFLNVYAPVICSSSTDGRTDSFSPSTLSSSRNLFILGDFNCHHHLWDSRGTPDSRGEEVIH